MSRQERQQNAGHMNKLEPDKLVSVPQATQNEGSVNIEASTDNDEADRSVQRVNERRYPRRTKSSPLLSSINSLT